MKILHYISIFAICAVLLIGSTRAFAIVTQWATRVVASANCLNPNNAIGPEDQKDAQLQPGGWIILEFDQVIDQDWCDWDFRIFSFLGDVTVLVSDNPNGPWEQCNTRRLWPHLDGEVPDLSSSNKRYVKIINDSLTGSAFLDAVGDLLNGCSQFTLCVPGSAMVTSTVTNMDSLNRYAYNVTPTTSEINVFSIQVGDQVSSNYFNFQQPDGWSHKIVNRDGAWYLIFHLFEGSSLPSGQTSQFGFDNLSSEYSCFDWELKCDESCDFDVDNSSAHPDTCGVYAPGRYTIPSLTEWGLIIFGVVLIGFITYVFLRRRKAIGIGV